MVSKAPFPLTHSQAAAAALLASKRLNEAADKARAGAGDVLQSCNKKPQKLRADRQRLDCPHCEWPCVVRTSMKLSNLTRETMYACTNVECGHTFVGLTEIVRTLSPSATPNPSVNLPLSSHVRREVLRAQVEHAQTAAHVPLFTTPITGDLFQVGAHDPPD